MKAWILAAQFNGVFDAGGAVCLAVEEVLCSLPTEHAAIFGTDALLDYRSHRPFVTVNDWVLGSVETSELALNRVKNDLGSPVLVLHGVKPDAKWEPFPRIVIELAT